MNDNSELTAEKVADSEEFTTHGRGPETKESADDVKLKAKLEEFDKKIGYTPEKRGRGFRSLDPKEVLIWAAIAVLMSFSLSAPFGLYCTWRKLKRKPGIPKRYKWIPTFGNPIPKEGYRSMEQPNRRIARFFLTPKTSATSQKWLMLTGVFVIIIGFGLTLNPLGSYIIYGYTPDVLWQYIQCFCIMLAGSFLIRASARIKAEHLREQGMYLLASNFDALPLDYASEIFAVPEPALADDLQKVIDADLLDPSYIDYQLLVYASDEGIERAPKKKKQRMDYFSQQLKQEATEFDGIDLHSDFQMFDRFAQTLVNRAITDELLYKHSIEYLDFYYPLVIALAKGSHQIKDLEPTLSQSELESIRKKRGGRASNKKKDVKADRNPEKIIMQFAHDKKEAGLLSVKRCLDEINNQIQEVLEEF